MKRYKIDHLCYDHLLYFTNSYINSYIHYIYSLHKYYKY